jgi:hypothetical protein
MNAKLKIVQKLLSIKKLWQISCMKTRCNLLILSATTLLYGCASGQHDLTLSPVGPPSIQSMAANDKGTLVVFSAYDVTAAGVGDYEHRRHYSDYKILTQDGKLLQTVHNDSNTVLREATQVKLLPGTYRVVAHANGYGVVTVPVIIEKNEVTTVHLEGGGAWENAIAQNQANVVRLPDGRVVGWRTEESPQSNSVGPAQVK